MEFNMNRYMELTKLLGVLRELKVQKTNMLAVFENCSNTAKDIVEQYDTTIKNTQTEIASYKEGRFEHYLKDDEGLFSLMGALEKQKENLMSDFESCTNIVEDIVKKYDLVMIDVQNELALLREEMFGTKAAKIAINGCWECDWDGNFTPWLDSQCRVDYGDGFKSEYNLTWYIADISELKLRDDSNVPVETICTDELIRRLHQGEKIIGVELIEKDGLFRLRHPNASIFKIIKDRAPVINTTDDRVCISMDDDYYLIDYTGYVEYYEKYDDWLFELIRDCEISNIIPLIDEDYFEECKDEILDAMERNSEGLTGLCFDFVCL